MESTLEPAVDGAPDAEDLARQPTMNPTMQITGRVLSASSPEAKPFLDDWDEEFHCPKWSAPRYRLLAQRNGEFLCRGEFLRDRTAAAHKVTPLVTDPMV